MKTWRFYDTSGKDSQYAEVFGPTGLNHGDRIILVGPNAKEDARLIAAAQELLAACEAAAMFIRPPGSRELQRAMANTLGHTLTKCDADIIWEQLQHAIAEGSTQCK